METRAAKHLYVAGLVAEKWREGASLPVTDRFHLRRDFTNQNITSLLRHQCE